MTTGSEQLDRIVEQLPPTQPDGISGCVPESRLWCRRGSLPLPTLGSGCSPSLLSSLLSLSWRRNFGIVVASGTCWHRLTTQIDTDEAALARTAVPWAYAVLFMAVAV